MALLCMPRCSRFSFNPAFVTHAAQIYQDADGTSTFDKILPLHARKRHLTLVQTKRRDNPNKAVGGWGDHVYVCVFRKTVPAQSFTEEGVASSTSKKKSTVQIYRPPHLRTEEENALIRLKELENKMHFLIAREMILDEMEEWVLR